MSKKIFLFLCIFIIFKSQKIFSQNSQALCITYTKEIIISIDTTQVLNIKDEIGKLNYMLSENSKELEYELLINNFQSKFEEKKSLSSGSKNEHLKKLAGNFGGTRGTFYVNKKDSIYINHREYGGQDFNVIMHINNWEITNQSKLINNYICYKSTSIDTLINTKGTFKYEVIAWFSPELPSFFGPAAYFGLPGLILELDNGKTILKATKIIFSESPKERVKLSKNGISITEEEYEQFVNKTARDLLKQSFKN